MSRTGRHRGVALRAWRAVLGDVRGLPANPPRCSQIRKRVACSPPPPGTCADRAPEPRIESAEI
eukprot:6413222-Prymnesium_polylepis.1